MGYVAIVIGMDCGMGGAIVPGDQSRCVAVRG